MGRIFFLLIIGFVLWLAFRGFFRAQVRGASASPPAPRTEDMVACARCGVNLPKSEAREEAGRYFCRDNPHCRAHP